MRSELKSKIKESIKDRTVFCFAGRRVRILEIVGINKVKVLNLKSNKNTFRVLTVPYNRLEKIIYPYSHKDPKSFFKRKGFTSIPSDEGSPLMEKKVNGHLVTVGFSSPAKKKEFSISLGVEHKDGSASWVQTEDTDLNKILERIPEFVNLVASKDKK